MRIVHCLTQTELTGSEVYAFELVRSQLDCGDEITVLSDAFHLPFPELKKITCHQVPLSGSGAGARLKLFFSLLKILKKAKPEIVHCHSRGAARHLSWVCWLLKIPMLSTLHGRQHYSVSKRFFPKSFGDRITVMCENLRSDLVDTFKIPIKKIDLTPNPIDGTLLQVQDKHPPPGNKATQPDAIHLGLLGRTSGPKGERISFFCKNVFPKLLSEFTEVHLSFCLPTPFAPVDDLASTFPKQVTVSVGALPREKTLEWMHQQNGILGGGRVALEAISLGIPVFAWGEFEVLGRVTSDNFSVFAKSNFGDVGPSRSQREKEQSSHDIVTQLKNWIEAQFLSEKTALFDGSSPESESKISQGHVQRRKDLEILKSLVLEQYGLTAVRELFSRIYKRTCFDFHTPGWIPSLMYHQVASHPVPGPHKIWILESNFKKHCEYFKNQGYTTLWMSELWDFYLGRKNWKDFPKKPLVITFDDGYRSTLTRAQPQLKRYGLKANVFLLSDSSKSKNTWDDIDTGNESELLSPTERQQLDQNVWEIGSHGHNHKSFRELSSAEAAQELLQSRTALEREFKKPVVGFAYPFGKIEHSDLVLKSGYSWGFSTDSGGRTWMENPAVLFRVNVFPNDGVWALFKKCRPSYRQRFDRKHSRNLNISSPK